jgi:hypothetical protein
MKAGTDLSTGSGFAVRICRTANEIDSALDFFSQRRRDLTHLLLEALEDFQATWCANVGVANEGCRYLGSARQICSKEGVHEGNYLGTALAPPSEVGAIALDIAERAQRAGYRGIAGVDLGLTKDGRLLVFDLNFRLNACTKQVVFHDSACERIGAKVSRSVRFAHSRSLSEVTQELRPFVEAGKMLVFAALDGSRHEKVRSGCTLSALLLGETIEEVDALAARLRG